MKLQVMNSEAIELAGYDKRVNKLRIKYVGNDSFYDYHDVPPEVYEQFVRADSHGAFVNENIKTAYKFTEFKPF
jgi:hypothetical protein